MVRTVPDDFVAEIVRVANESPLIPLFEIDVSATERLRIAPYLRQVTWPASGGNTYEPFPLLFDAFRESGEEDATTATVTIPNADRQLIPTLIANRGLTDKAVVCHLVSKDTLDETVAIQWDYEIGHAAATMDVITFELGAAEVYEHTGPSQRYSRWHCGWTFGDPDT